MKTRDEDRSYSLENPSKLHLEKIGCFKDYETGPMTPETDTKRILPRELGRIDKQYTTTNNNPDFTYDTNIRYKLHPFDCIGRGREAKVNYIGIQDGGYCWGGKDAPTGTVLPDD